MVVGDERAVELPVAVAVEVVARAVEVVGCRPVVEVLGRALRTRYEVVVDDVLVVVGC